MPVDGIPIIGYLPKVSSVYVCAMHPGVTLAAIVGRLASEEIVGVRRAMNLARAVPIDSFRCRDFF